MATKGLKQTAEILATLPDDEQLDAARAERKAAGTNNMLPGTVLGLPAGLVAAKLDPVLDEGRKAGLRAKWVSLGWLELEGLHQVVGYPNGCHVFVKREADYKQDCRERDSRMARMAQQGQMMIGNA